MNRGPSARLLLLLLLASYAAWVLSHWGPACVSPDAVGLCQQAHQLAESGVGSFQPESPAQLVGTHWVETGDNTYRGRFPPAYPILLGLAYRLVGSGWSLLLGPLLGVVAVGLLFGIGWSAWRREGSLEGSSPAGGQASGDLPTALLGGLLLATLPLYNRLALHGDTHVPAAACVLAGIWLLLRWDREPSRRRAFAAGLAWGLLPSIRYGEVVMSLAAGSFMVFRAVRAGRESGHRRTILPALAGAGLPVVLLGVYHTVAFGRPWRTGYALTNEQTAFSLSQIPDHLAFYFGNLVGHPAVALSAAFGVCALGLMIWNREARPVGLFLLGAVLPSVLLYTAYYWQDPEYPSLVLRFFLPAMVCLLVAITWLLSFSRGRTRWVVRAVAMGLIVLGAVDSEGEMREEGLALQGGSALVAAARTAVPVGSVIICPRGLGEILSYTGLWHLVPQWLFPGDPQREQVIVPWEVTPDLVREQALRPAPMQADRGASLRSHYRDLPDSTLVRVVLEDVRKWQPSAGVYWIGDPAVVDRADRGLTGRRFRVLGYVVLPGPGGEEADTEDPSRHLPRIPIFRLEPDTAAVVPPARQISTVRRPDSG